MRPFVRFAPCCAIYCPIRHGDVDVDTVLDMVVPPLQTVTTPAGTLEIRFKSHKSMIEDGTALRRIDGLGFC